VRLPQSGPGEKGYNSPQIIHRDKTWGVMCSSRANCPAPNPDTNVDGRPFYEKGELTAIRVVDFVFPDIEDRL
jgi:hypothetical protein